MATKYDKWHEQYHKWLEKCLEEYETLTGEARTLNSGEPGFIEFAEDGDAFPHGYAGTNWVRGAVTPWRESEYYVE